jgi:5'(3')-deoxyribonucleotidase
MSKPIIAIDIDDVLAEGTCYLIDSVNKRHGLSLTSEDYHAVGGEFSGYYERVWRAHGVGDMVQYDDVAEEMRRDQAAVPLLPGAEFAIRQLIKRFHIVFITARPEEWEDATRRWFMQHFNKDDVELYFAGSDDGTRAVTKGQQAAQVGAVMLIDDNIRNCQTAITEGIEAILFGDYGWQSKASSLMHRCKSWPEVLEYLDAREF